MSTHPATTGASIKRSATAGFTATELLVAVHIVGILATIAIGGFSAAMDKGRVARSMDGLRGIQAAMWMASDDGNAFPDAAAFWSQYRGSENSGKYVILAADLIAHGGSASDHGSSEGAGATGGGEGRRRVEFVVLAVDEYGDQAEYIYIEDHGPPVVVTGPANDPGYRKQASPDLGEGDSDEPGESDGGGSGSGSGSAAGSGGGAGSRQMVGWNGAETTATESTEHGWIRDRRQASRPDGFSKNGVEQGSETSGGSNSSRISD